MVFRSVLCVMLLVSQMETLPLNQTEKSLLNQTEKSIMNQKEKSLLNLTEKTLLNQKEKSLLNQTEKSLLNQTGSDMELQDYSTKVAQSRVKRQIIKTNHECPNGEVKLHPFGCVTCEVYEQRTDKDCPIQEENAIYDHD